MSQQVTEADAATSSRISSDIDNPNDQNNVQVPEDEDDTITLTITFHQQPLPLIFPSSATISDLSSQIENDFSIPPSNQKLLITPKPGLLRAPFKDPTLSLSSISSRKITLLGSTASSISELNSVLATARQRSEARSLALRQARKIKPARYIDPRLASSAHYTFTRIEPLSHLPNPDRSRQYLTRLASDRGIKSAMARWKFSVGLLTEMDPAQHTTHESRTLGLNRNGGEVIELRLWTDDFAGFRDYKTVRKTLCHELAHNVHSEHDAKFWALMREIEEEVGRNDGSSGRNLGGEFATGLGTADEDVDGGGWTGGSYVLGGVGDDAQGGLTRRDVLARAAEERMRRIQKEQQEPNGESDGL